MPLTGFEIPPFMGSDSLTTPPGRRRPRKSGPLVGGYAVVGSEDIVAAPPGYQGGYSIQIQIFVLAEPTIVITDII
jgi:hypothetical protein